MIVPIQRLAGKRILIVEDQVLIAMETADVLEDAGAVVMASCTSVRDALAMLATTCDLDAAVLDVDLGDGTRIDRVAEQLQSLGVPFVFQTACDRKELPTCCRHARMTGKPVSATQLSSMLSEAMSD